MSDSNGGGAFFTGFIIGGLVGAVAALLWTPQSGEKTRLQLQERGIELKTQFEDMTAELQERSKGVAEGDATAETPQSEDEPATSEEPAADDEVA
jgi:gas vesicle protein